MRSAEHQVQSGTATSGSCFHRRCKPAFGDARYDRASTQLRRRAVSEHVHDRGRHPIDPPLVTHVRNPERKCRSRAFPHGKLVRFTRLLLMLAGNEPSMYAVWLACQPADAVASARTDEHACVADPRRCSRDHEQGWAVDVGHMRMELEEKLKDTVGKG